MTRTVEIQVHRGEITRTRTEEGEAAELQPGQVLVAIDKFGLTANNVSYAVSGDALGYWQFYPAEDNWGKVPVWGCANVIESRCPEVPVGERLWGFFPMASHVVLQPGNIAPDQFIDFAPHRRDLPGLYNGYRRTNAERTDSNSSQFDIARSQTGPHVIDVLLRCRHQQDVSRFCCGSNR